MSTGTASFAWREPSEACVRKKEGEGGGRDERVRVRASVREQFAIASCKHPCKF